MTAIAKPKVPRKISVRHRLLGSVLAAALMAIILPQSFLWATRLLCAWDTGMVVFLGWSWMLMMQATPQTMRRHAQQEDEGRLTILSLVTAAACASLGAIGVILRNKGLSSNFLVLHVALSVITIVGSWLLVHTIFAFHYAHSYYQDHKTLPECKAEGLDFPGELEPDYWDFLYFSFVIGMTSQVSDVEITARSIRRLSLIHGVLSFFFNTTILAMTVNIVAGLV
jgi:uncharacterized membrane protein